MQTVTVYEKRITLKQQYGLQTHLRMKLSGIFFIDFLLEDNHMSKEQV